MSKPVAVLISDIHYSLKNLELADKALRMAFNKAFELEIPIVIAGDLHDSKADLRAECVNALIRTFEKYENVSSYLLIGNHCKVNEKSKDHALNFLNSYTIVISAPVYIPYIRSYCIPYQSDPDELKTYLSTLPKDSRLIMHQGVEDSYSGEYIKDKSALPRECFKDFRVISGHYHTRQDIKCGNARKGAIGLFSYIGNPYTLNYAEAKDPDKGFQILIDDGTLEFVPTNLRKHAVFSINYDQWNTKETASPEVKEGDLLKVSLYGPKEAISKISKEEISERFSIKIPFKLELQFTKNQKNVKSTSSSWNDVLDQLCDTAAASELDKGHLKNKWRDLLGNS